MDFILEDYIDNYIQDAEAFDRKVAQHLKEIIPNTTHLDERIFKEVIQDLKKEIDRGENFKNAFHKMCKKYILTGDVISADLPELLTRIIVNIRLFLIYLSKKLGMEVEDIKKRIDSNDIKHIIHLIGHLELAPPNNNVVFATFDDDNLENDPFIGYKVKDIINMLGKDRSSFNKGEPLGVVKIRYKNIDNIEKKFPTFLDAGWYDKFYPAEKDDKYGRTRSLDPTLKNMPEIVHKNLKISEVTEDIQFIKEG
jgi:hypothetical protein